MKRQRRERGVMDSVSRFMIWTSGWMVGESTQKRSGVFCLFKRPVERIPVPFWTR